MKQHRVQKAYLNRFAVNGKLWVYEKHTGKKRSSPAGKCTIEEDFQSELIEKYQSTHIEKPGIENLRNIGKGRTLTRTEYDIILNWTALHLIRTTKDSGSTQEDYEAEFFRQYNIEQIFRSYFPYYRIITCPQNQYFITCDRPIIEMKVEDDVVRYFSLSPSELIIFNSRPDDFNVQGITFIDLINATIWALAESYVFSNQKELPIMMFNDIIRTYNIIPLMTEMTFQIIEEHK